ncbi:unnamed protein product [Soboliphyme baturini]|uniref:EamA domain-containing protein n=1 Tax=Soboliphyme baturini TaxID=241478 RepID=A0A183IKF2_9BILA|nr:unnamed protein product [Soboliphyme baturini]
MFIGETCCLIVYILFTKFHLLEKCRKTKPSVEVEERIKLNPFVFLVPTLCDLVATCIQYTGLTMTNASSYQMLRGDLLIIAAQLIVAAQMVFEELYVLKYNVDPPLAVGLEGIYGFIIMTLLIVAFYFIWVPPPFTNDPEGRLENAFDAFDQMNANSQILGSLIGLIISIAFYNVCGMTVTKNLSATTRKVSDSARTVLIWVVSLALGWQSFSYLQLIGFIVLISGMFIYNDIVFRPIIEKTMKRFNRTFKYCIVGMNVFRWADRCVALNRPFNHPFVQGNCVFIGEAGCLIAYFLLRKLRRFAPCKSFVKDDGKPHPPFNPLIFLFPTCCDLIVIVLNYTGLALTYAASYQMLRGGVIIFTTLLSVVFLHKSISWHKWAGIFVVIGGLVTVGVSDFLQGASDASSNPNGVIAGDLLIVLVQFVAAAELVYEERFVVKYNVKPPIAVGLEGAYGIVLLTVVTIGAYFIKVPRQFTTDPDARLENALVALAQISANHVILGCLLGIIICIPIYNVCGVTMSKNLSALTRKLIGFIILLAGLMIYNEVLAQPFSNLFKLKCVNNRRPNYAQCKNGTDCSESGVRLISPNTCGV